MYNLEFHYFIYELGEDNKTIILYYPGLRTIDERKFEF